MTTREDTKLSPERGSNPAARFRRRERLGDNARAALGLTLLAVLFYLPILLGLRTFPDGDFTHHFLPFSLFSGKLWLISRRRCGTPTPIPAIRSGLIFKRLYSIPRPMPFCC